MIWEIINWGPGECFVVFLFSCCVWSWFYFKDTRMHFCLLVLLGETTCYQCPPVYQTWCETPKKALEKPPTFPAPVSHWCLPKWRTADKSLCCLYWQRLKSRLALVPAALSCQAIFHHFTPQALGQPWALTSLCLLVVFAVPKCQTEIKIPPHTCSWHRSQLPPPKVCLHTLPLAIINDSDGNISKLWINDIRIFTGAVLLNSPPAEGALRRILWEWE